MLPLAGGHYPWNWIKWKNSFRASIIVIDIEGDPLAEEVEFGGGFSGEEILLIELAKFTQ